MIGLISLKILKQLSYYLLLLIHVAYTLIKEYVPIHCNFFQVMVLLKLLKTPKHLISYLPIMVCTKHVYKNVES